MLKKQNDIKQDKVTVLRWNIKVRSKVVKNGQLLPGPQWNYELFCSDRAQPDRTRIWWNLRGYCFITQWTCRDVMHLLIIHFRANWATVTRELHWMPVCCRVGPVRFAPSSGSPHGLCFQCRTAGVPRRPAITTESCLTAVIRIQEDFPTEGLEEKLGHVSFFQTFVLTSSPCV